MRKLFLSMHGGANGTSELSFFTFRWVMTTWTFVSNLIALQYRVLKLRIFFCLHVAQSFSGQTFLLDETFIWNDDRRSLLIFLQEMSTIWICITLVLAFTFFTNLWQEMKFLFWHGQVTCVSWPWRNFCFQRPWRDYELCSYLLLHNFGRKIRVFFL